MSDQTALFDEGRDPDEVIPQKKGFTGKSLGGRPKGAVSNTTKWVRRFLQPHKQALLEAGVAQALAGDTNALRLLYAYAFGLPRPAPTGIDDLPPMSTPDELRRAMHVFIERAAVGEIPADEAQSFVHMAHEILVALSIDPVTSRTPVIESQTGRDLLAERLARAIEARKQLAAGAGTNGNGHGAPNSHGDYSAAEGGPEPAIANEPEVEEDAELSRFARIMTAKEDQE
jgi:hypothetical protein